MTARYQSVLFTPAVQAEQDRHGSRAPYAAYLAKHGEEAAEPDRLTPEAAAFIAARDSFYMASVTETGWPYIQHRGGPRGFLRVIDDRTIGFADLRGNRQYISLGNLGADNRVSLFLMDYPNRARLKLIGRARLTDPEAEPTLMATLTGAAQRPVEHGIVITVEAFDWNCPQHIEPRFTAADLQPELQRLGAHIARLEADLAAERARNQAGRGEEPGTP